MSLIWQEGFYYVLFLCRFLATGMSFRSIAFSFRLGETTVNRIVEDTCIAIKNVVMPFYIFQSLTKKDGGKKIQRDSFVKNGIFQTAWVLLTANTFTCLHPKIQDQRTLIIRAVSLLY